MPVLKSYKGFKPGDKKHRQRFSACLSEFLRAPINAEVMVMQRRGAVLSRLAAQAAEFTAHTNTAAWQNVQNVVAVFADDVGDMDMGWALAFDEVDLTGTPRASFDIVGHTTGFSFRRVPDGHRAEIHGVAGSRVNIPIDTYGGGLGFLQNWFDDQEWWNVEDAANTFRYQESEQKATLHYGLISAVTDTITYDTTGDNATQKDAISIFKAAAECIVDNRATGLGISAQTPFLLYTHINNWARVLKALAAVVPDTSQKIQPVNVRVVPTTFVSASYLGWIGAPGRKSKYGRRLNMEVLEDFDLTMRGRDLVGWYRYGSYLNAAQWRRVPAS